MKARSGISLSRTASAPAIDLLVIALLWGLSLWVVHPLGDFPLNDDWSWGLAVKHLLEKGDFRPPGWTGMPLLTNVLWGSLFCLPGGFSFNALRFSTLTLSWLGITGVYLLMKTLHQPRWLAITAALTLGFNPIYYALSNTFMTDVPFTTLTIFAALFFLRSLENGSLRDWLLGTVIAIAAILSRQLALAVPLAFGVALILKNGISIRSLARAVIPPALCLGALFAFQHWLAATGRLPADYYQKTDGLLLVLVTPQKLDGVLPENTYAGLLYLGLFLSPVFVFAWPRIWEVQQKKARIFFAISLAGMALCEGIRASCGLEYLQPVARGVLVKSGIGPLTLRDVLILNLHHVTPLPTVFWAAVTALNLLGAAGLIAAIGLIAVNRAAKFWPGRMNAGEAAGTFLLFTAVVYLLPILIDDTSFDRYFVPAIPFFAAGIASAFPQLPGAVSRVRSFAAAALLVAFSLFAVCGTRDYLAWNRVRWEALHDLMADNRVGLEDIDGGFEFNGWHEYNPNYQKGPGKSWWWVKRETYQIGFGPVPGYTVTREYDFHWWLPPHSGKLVVLKQNPPKVPQQ